MDSSRRQSGVAFEHIVGDVFRKAGWKVRSQVPLGDFRADLLVDAGGRQYLVEVKSLSEGRRDRLVPLLAQAILQAKTAAAKCQRPTVPVAIVASNRVPTSVAEEARRFAVRHAPEVGAGVIDTEGLRVFTGHGLDRLDASPTRRVTASLGSRPKPPQLFSDLNQWMLKILVGQTLQPSHLSVPREKFRNASQLAAAANVSTMTAYRLVHRLADQGFVDERQNYLELARIEELLQRWVSANREAFAEIPARWIIGGNTEQLYASLAEYACDGNGSARRERGREDLSVRARVRCCLGLFAAADVLGFGFVRGVPPHIWLERVEPDVLRRFGLTANDSPSPPDVYIRVPANREAVFRAATTADGVPVSDVLQIWLDASAHPARGPAQAEVIRKRALGSLLPVTSDDGRIS